MRGFRFRLEPVLGLRRHELERRRLELGRARVGLRTAVRVRHQADDALRGGQALRAERVARGVSAGELRDLERAVEHVLGERARAEASVRAAEARVAQALGAVTSARREVRALEILREKALAEHRRELARREQAELDEVGGRSRRRGLEAAW